MRPGIEVDITETILKIKILKDDVVYDSASVPLRYLAEKLKPYLIATEAPHTAETSEATTHHKDG